ncbi:Actin-interacting protein 1 [Nymphon striatum]|nr:Actin-interacting protein 1 [Nymphon striatum]
MWSHDSQRLVIVGEGKQRFGHVINAETGTSVGEIAGHSKQINTCDFKPSRPFRIITGSEDNMVGIFEGPPFKFKRTIQDHTRYVQVVRFSPNGDKFATAGFDGRMFLYETKTYEKLGEFGDPAHGGGVYGLSWSADGTQILSCSGDKTCKVWSVDSLEMEKEFVMGKTVDDQQVTCLWQGSHLISVGLSGYITYLDVNNPEKPLKVVKGHSKPINSIILSKDRNTLFSGGHDGKIDILYVNPTPFSVLKEQLALISRDEKKMKLKCIIENIQVSSIETWNSTNDNDIIQGTSHTNQVQDMALYEDVIYTCGMDDFVRCIDTITNSYKTEAISMNSQPRGVSVTPDGIVIVACIKEVAFIKDGRRVSGFPITYEGTCVSFCSESNEVAVGGCELNYYNPENIQIMRKPLKNLEMDFTVHIYSLNGTELTEKKTMKQRGQITDIAYSPDGKYLVASDNSRRVVLYDTSSYEPAHTNDWCFHSAKVACVAWSPNSRYVASGSLDTNIIIWDTTAPLEKFYLKQCHKMSQVNQVIWQDDKTLISAGLDANIKIWDLQLK